MNPQGTQDTNRAATVDPTSRQDNRLPRPLNPGELIQVGGNTPTVRLQDIVFSGYPN